MFVSSCSKSKIDSEIASENGNDFRTMSFAGIPLESVSINNGISSFCQNNLLIFNSWDDYHKMIAQLDSQIDIELNAFDASINADQLSDDDYNSKCETLGFDEENVLRRFERNLGFCSLRKKLKL